MGVPEQMKVSVQMGVSEHKIRMNKRLRKVVCGGWVGGGWMYFDISVSSGAF